MQHKFALITALLLPPLAAIDAADSSSLQPPRYVGKPKPEHAVTNRAFRGIPSMAVAPGGRLWANWYAGVTPGEDHNNYVVLSTSGNGGATWKEVLIIDPDGGGMARAFDPELWVSPDGRLFVFWAQMEKGRRDTRLGVWCMETRQADAEQPEWSRPRRITDGVMMCKPLTLATGEWVLPVSKWAAHDNSAQLIVSTDKGESWTLRGGCNVPVEARSADEHMFIERRDGSIWLLVRTKYGIGESISTDRGVTWPELKPAAIRHATARFFISRLASGNLLLVKHGPLDLRTSRSHLTAFISTDDGRTWSGGLMLDKRLGVSYPDGQQTPDGLIRIIRISRDSVETIEHLEQSALNIRAYRKLDGDLAAATLGLGNQLCHSGQSAQYLLLRLNDFGLDFLGRSGTPAGIDGNGRPLDFGGQLDGQTKKTHRTKQDDQQHGDQRRDVVIEHVG